jgi:plasmid maintenance system antidote protein VapI
MEPAFLVSPGEILSKELKARGITKREFASMTGIPAEVLRRLFKGKEPLTLVMAFKLEEALEGIPARFWMRCEQKYRKRLRRLQGIATASISRK